MSHLGNYSRRTKYRKIAAEVVKFVEEACGNCETETTVHDESGNICISEQFDMLEHCEIGAVVGNCTQTETAAADACNKFTDIIGESAVDRQDQFTDDSLSDISIQITGNAEANEPAFTEC